MMANYFQTITPPDEEPVSLLEARQHLRLDDGDTTQDSAIAMMITAARLQAEYITRRALITQKWRLTLDQFPGYGFFATAIWAPFGFGASSGFGDYLTTGYSVIATRGNEIKLPGMPLQSVDAIKYIDTGGTQQTLNSATDYIVGAVSEPARITPSYGKWWPPTRGQIESVTVDYTCGYGEPPDVPAEIKYWMFLRIGALYENREEFVVDRRIVAVELPFVDSLLDSYRVWNF